MISRISVRTADEPCFCQECHDESIHGFVFYWTEIFQQSVFVCDKCIGNAKKYQIIKNGQDAIPK